MLRPKIIKNDFIGVYLYFKRSIDTGRFDTDYSVLMEAENALSATMLQSGTEKRHQALQNWVDQYVNTKQWGSCLKALCQQKSRKKLYLISLDRKSYV